MIQVYKNECIIVALAPLLYLLLVVHLLSKLFLACQPSVRNEMRKGGRVDAMRSALALLVAAAQLRLVGGWLGWVGWRSNCGCGCERRRNDQTKR
jgi:hypothetical protein